ncbi:MAG: hypothetical protein ACKVYV_18120 [Limisphaerales bacterium]
MNLGGTLVELLVSPFVWEGRINGKLIWGIVPLYAGWVVNELGAARATSRTALNTGASFLWAGLHWSWLLFVERVGPASRGAVAVSLLVTGVVLAAGAVALVAGLRRKLPRRLRFLGHTRFANYFMIAIYPMQSGFLAWTWPRVAAVAMFAPVVWVLVQMARLPWRGR